MNKVLYTDMRYYYRNLNQGVVQNAASLVRPKKKGGVQLSNNSVLNFPVPSENDYAK